MCVYTYRHSRAHLQLSPVVGEGLVVLGVQRAGGGKHDGRVQVGDDAGYSAGCCDAGLSALVAGLEGREHQRHLRTHTQTSKAINLHGRMCRYQTSARDGSF